jgi:hypothetical protein
MVNMNQDGPPAREPFEAKDQSLQVAIPPADEVSRMFGYAHRRPKDILETVAKLFDILSTVCSLGLPRQAFFEKYPRGANSLKDWRIHVYDTLVQEIDFLFCGAEGDWTRQKTHMLGSIIFRFISEIPWYHRGQCHLLECLMKWMNQELFTDEIRYQSHTQFGRYQSPMMPGCSTVLTSPQVLLSIGESLESDILVGLEARTWNGEGSRWVNLQAFIALLYGQSRRSIKELDDRSLAHIFYTIDCGLFLWRGPKDTLFEEHITVAALWLNRAWPRLHRTVKHRALNTYWEQMSTSPRSSRRPNLLDSDYPEDNPKEFAVAQKCLEWASLLRHHGVQIHQIQDPRVRRIVNKTGRIMQECGDAYLDRWTDLIQVERGHQFDS